MLLVKGTEWENEGENAKESLYRKSYFLLGFFDTARLKRRMNGFNHKGGRAVYMSSTETLMSVHIDNKR